MQEKGFIRFSKLIAQLEMGNGHCQGHDVLALINESHCYVVKA